jgi:hypothetical protein
MSSVRQSRGNDIYDDSSNNGNNGGAGMRFGSDVEGEIVRLSVGNLKGE